MPRLRWVLLYVAGLLALPWLMAAFAWMFRAAFTVFLGRA